MEWCMINKCLDRIHHCLLEEQTKIANMLKARLVDENVIITSKKKLDTKNDFRNYIWIEVEFGDEAKRKYKLTLFTNDIDTNTGNTHTQFGRIQFWKDMKDSEIEKEHCIEPPRILFKQSKKTDYFMYRTGYSTDEVVEEFLKYMKKPGEKKNKQIRECKEEGVPYCIMNTYLGRIKDCLMIERRNIVEHLKEKLENSKVKIIQKTGRNQINDYRNYIWVEVQVVDDKNKTRSYWLTLFANDQDKEVGTTTQFGRIQFWKDIEDSGPHDKCCVSGWNLYFDKGETTEHFIYREGYSTENVVEEFVCYFNACEAEHKEVGENTNE